MIRSATLLVCTGLFSYTLAANRAVDTLIGADFVRLRAALAERFSGDRLSREVVQVRMIFNYGYDSQMIDRPVRFGPQFRPPKMRELPMARAEGGLTLFSATELTTIDEHASTHIRAMALLGINCGFGNHDIGLIEPSHLDLETGWHNFPRHKTGMPRRCRLWPETIAAIEASSAARPDCDLPLLFVTKYRKPWYKDSRSSPLSAEFRSCSEQRSCTEGIVILRPAPHI